MESNSAQQQLDDLRRHREITSERLRSPWWLHAAVGLLVAGLGLGAVLVPDSLVNPFYGVAVLVALGLGWLQTSYWGVRRRGYGDPGTSAWTLLLLFLALSGLIVALGAHSLGNELVTGLALVVAGLGTALLSAGYERWLRHRVREGR